LKCNEGKLEGKYLSIAYITYKNHLMNQLYIQ